MPSTSDDVAESAKNSSLRAAIITAKGSVQSSWDYAQLSCRTLCSISLESSHFWQCGGHKRPLIQVTESAWLTWGVICQSMTTTGSQLWQSPWWVSSQLYNLGRPVTMYNFQKDQFQIWATLYFGDNIIIWIICYHCISEIDWEG